MKIQDDDILLLNQGGTDYKITAKQYKEFVNTKPAPPWEGKYGIFHVKNATGRVALINACEGWDVTPNGDGTYSWSDIRLIGDFNAGDEIVFTIGAQATHLFNNPDNYNNPENWEFGELTDVSRVTNLNRYFKGCRKFNSDISWWDTSNVTSMNDMFSNAEEFNQDISGWNVSKVQSDNSQNSMMYMFNKAYSFNQDLSKWCVQHIDERPTYFDSNTTAWTKPKPVWGTCPRGEDQP